MSNRSFRSLWIRLQIEDKRSIPIPLPIPLYIFEELLDSFLDILIIACFFAPKAPAPSTSSRVSVQLVKELVVAIIILLRSVNSDEPYDLVDVTTDKVKVLIKIR